MELRPYQRDVVRDIYAAIRDGAHRIMLWAPTGSGKTVVARHIAADSLARGWRVIFISHRKQILLQTARTFAGLATPSWIWASRPYDWDGRLQLCMVQSMTRQTGKWKHWLRMPKTLWIVDEAHRTALTYDCLISALRDPGQALWIGLSATISDLPTPVGPADLFDRLVCAPHYTELYRLGSLLRPECHTLEPHRRKDFSRVGIRSKEWVPGELAALLSDEHHLRDVIGYLDELHPDRQRTITFSPTQDHARLVASMLPDAACLVSSGATIRDEPATPEQVVDALRVGSIRTMCSVDMIAEGFDLPDIDAAIDLQPTLQRHKHTQKAGRIARISPGKERAVWVDAVGNRLRFGDLEHQAIPVLEYARERRTRSEAIAQQFCLCDHCGGLIPSGSGVCPDCGEPPSVTVRRQAPCDVDGWRPVELGLVTPDPKGEAKLDYVRWATEAFARGMKPGYAYSRYLAAHGKKPAWQYMQGAVFGHAGITDDVRQIYREYLRQVYPGQPEQQERWYRYEFGREDNS